MKTTTTTLRMASALTLCLGLSMPALAETTPTPTPAGDAGAGAAVATTGSEPAATPAPAAGAGAGAATATAPSGGLTLNLEPVKFENGRWYNSDDIPTFKIDENGDLDYASFSGYRRYHSECHVCHGPDGEGSTYAPALKNSVTHTVDYYQFQEIVASGKQNVGTGQANQVMPAFGTNRNVWCYVDDIYTYLLAHGTDAIPRGRPAKKAKKDDAYAANENSCMEN